MKLYRQLAFLLMVATGLFGQNRNPRLNGTKKYGTIRVRQFDSCKTFYSKLVPPKIKVSYSYKKPRRVKVPAYKLSSKLLFKKYVYVKIDELELAEERLPALENGTLLEARLEEIVDCDMQALFDLDSSKTVYTSPLGLIQRYSICDQDSLPDSIKVTRTLPKRIFGTRKKYLTWKASSSENIDSLETTSHNRNSILSTVKAWSAIVNFSDKHKTPYVLVFDNPKYKVGTTRPEHFEVPIKSDVLVQVTYPKVGTGNYLRKEWPQQTGWNNKLVKVPPKPAKLDKGCSEKVHGKSDSVE